MAVPDPLTMALSYLKLRARIADRAKDAVTWHLNAFIIN